jgi:hypothetical protein
VCFIHSFQTLFFIPQFLSVGEEYVVQSVTLHKYVVRSVTLHKYVVQSVTLHKYVVQSVTLHKYVVQSVTLHKYFSSGVYILFRSCFVIVIVLLAHVTLERAIACRTLNVFLSFSSFSFLKFFFIFYKLTRYRVNFR